MLSIMRKKAGSWMLKIILGIIAIVFALWGVGGRGTSGKVKVASVNGETITYEEFNEEYRALIEEYRKILGDENFSDEIIKSLNLKEQALDQIIDRRLMVSEALKLNFQVTDKELGVTIMQMAAFQRNGSFDRRVYERLLSQMRLTKEAFEDMQREAILIEKLKLFLTGSVKVSEEEIKEWYKWENAEVNIDFVKFKPAMTGDVRVTEEETKKFYEENKSLYKTEPKIKIQFVRFKPDEYKPKITIDDEEIEKYYEENPEEFETPKTVEARHILVKVGLGASEELVEKAKKRAEAIMNRAKGGMDFAELARKYSDGPSGPRGGSLGAFQKNEMVKPFADKAFSMRPGEISEPVRTQYGWHIIKVEKVNEATVLSEREAKKAILKKLLEERAKNLAYDDAEAMFDVCLEVEELDRAAKERNIPMLTTDFFSQNSKIQGVKDQDKFRSIAFKLSGKEISDIHDLGDGYYILQAADRIPEKIPEFDEVRKKVHSDLIKKKIDQKTFKKANAFLAALKDGSPMSSEKKRFKLSAVSTGYFKRDGSIPKIGYEVEISKIAFNLSRKTPFPENAIKGKNGYYIIRFKDRKEPDVDGLADEKQIMEKKLLSQKRDEMIKMWLSQVKRNSDIKKEKDFYKI